MLIGASTLATVAVVGAIGERRRATRRDLDQVGVIDWRGVQLAALIGLLVLGYFWIRA